MRALLTHVVVRRSGNVARRAMEIECESIRIGRDLANEIPLTGLSVALHHAEIVQRTDAVYLVPRPPESVLLGGRRIDGDVRLAAGDVLRIGGHELRVLDFEGEFDVSLEVERVETPEDEIEGLARRTKIEIEGGIWTRRKGSWLAVAAVLIGFLLLPFGLGRQGSWSTGPISNGHAAIADDCSRCHAPFAAVRNDDCLECHASIASHVEARDELAYLDALRCGGCHLEHRGADGLAALADERCASCHADLDETHETRLSPASDFGADHPEFTLHMLRVSDRAEGDEAGRVGPVRVAWSPEAREASGLKFSHLDHVGGVRRADQSQGTLRCDACHVPDEGGRRMRPIGFEEHCRSCHPLNYGSESAWIRADQAPHGAPGELFRYLRRAYLEDALPREPGETREEQQRRQNLFVRPGRQRTAEEERILQAVEQRATGALELLMSDAYCGNCHTLEPEASPSPSDVAPVALTRAWLGTSRFDHASHATARCGACHPRAAVHSEEYEAVSEGFERAAGTEAAAIPYGLVSSAKLRADGIEPSDEASDVLVPGLDVCRRCHAGSFASAPRVASPCVMCHPYHQPGHAPILERARASAMR